MKLGQFIIDESAFLDDGQIAIDIEGRGTVYITDNQDGVSIDIYPLWAAEEPILASYLLSEDFEKPLHEYIIHSYEYGAPLTFTCMAEDAEHAKEQFQNAYAHCTIADITRWQSVTCNSTV